jgi:preprotein translocase subunit SecE
MVGNPFHKIRGFFVEVAGELKKSSWPTRKELIDSTVVVLVTVFVLGLFVSLADLLFVNVVRWLTQST